DDGARDNQRKNQDEQRLLEGERRVLGIEWIERDGHGLTVRDREHDEHDQQRDKNESREGFAHRGLLTAAPEYSLSGAYAPFLLRRSRISLPVLKNGTDFLATATCAPVRGLRPVRAGRCLTEK